MSMTQDEASKTLQQTVTKEDQLPSTSSITPEVSQETSLAVLEQRLLQLKHGEPVAALLALCQTSEQEASELVNQIMAQVEELKRSLSKEEFKKAMTQLLFTAARQGRLEVVKSLVGKGYADKHAVDEKGNNLLHVAAEQDDPDLYKYCNMLEKDHPNQLNQTFLHVAVAHNRPEFVKRGLEAKLNATASASFAMENNDKSLVMPPLHYAVYQGYSEIVEALLESPDVNKESHLKETVVDKGNLLHLAIFGGQVKMLQDLLLKENLLPLLNMRNTLNLSPLGLAAVLGRKDMMTLLVNAKAELFSDKDYFIPPLHAAVCSCDLSVVVQVMRHLQDHPEALKWQLDKEFPAHLMMDLVKVHVELKLEYSKEIYTPRRWAEELSKVVQAKLDSLDETDELAKAYYQPKLEPLQDMTGFLRNIHPFVRDSSFNDKSKVYQQFIAQLDELESKVVQTQYQNLVLKGGGPKGIAYVGAIQALEKWLGDEHKHLPHLRRIAGTSAGAITALGLALGLHSDEIQALLNDKKLTDFIEGSFDPQKIKSISKEFSIGKLLKAAADIIKRNYKAHHRSESAPKAAFHALKEAYTATGLCSGEDFRGWIEDLIKAHTGIPFLTLGDLHGLAEKSAITPQKDKKTGKDRYYKELYVVATQLLPQAQVKIFSSENTTDTLMPHLIVSDLIRASMSIPLIFEPHPLYYKTQQGERLIVQDKSLYVDGGLLLNFPIQLFDNVEYHPFGFGHKDTSSFQIPNRQTLGLSLFTPPEHLEAPAEDIKNKKELLQLLGNVYNEAEAIYAELQRPIDKERTIEINNLGVSLFEFDLPHRGDEVSQAAKQHRKDKDEKAEKRITQEDLIEAGYQATTQFLAKVNPAYAVETKKEESQAPQKEIPQEEKNSAQLGKEWDKRTSSATNSNKVGLALVSNTLEKQEEKPGNFMKG